MRKCNECGNAFEATKEHTELDLYANHSIQHQPTPQQWHDAYETIQTWKEKSKATASRENP